MSRLPHEGERGRVRELTHRYLDGLAGPAEVAELGQAIGHSRAAAEEFVDLVAVHRLAREILLSTVEEGVAAPETRGSSDPARLPVRSSRRRRSRAMSPRRRPALAWAAAAILAAAAGAYVCTQRSRTGGAAPTAETVSVRGPVTLTGQGRRLRATENAALRPGDHIATETGGRATVRYADGCTVELNEQTALALGEETGTRQLSLERGDVFVQTGAAVALNAGRHDAVEVLGTAFELSVRAEGTVLRMARGKARFGAPGRAIFVEGGSASHVRPGGVPGSPQPVELAAIAPWRVDLGAGLAGHWSFDEGAGTRAADSSGQGNHATLRGATWTAGRFGQAVRCDSGAYVDVGNGLALRITDHVTVSAWLKILAPAESNSWCCVAGQFQPDRNYNFYVSNQLSVGDVSRQAAEWRFYFAHQWEKPGYCQSFTDFLLDRGAWHHVAGVMTTADGGSHRYYVDGRLVAAHRDLGFQRLVTSDASFRLGWGSSAFSGCLDEVRIYRRALSAEEVARLAQPQGE